MTESCEGLPSITKHSLLIIVDKANKKSILRKCRVDVCKYLVAELISNVTKRNFCYESNVEGFYGYAMQYLPNDDELPIIYYEIGARNVDGVRTITRLCGL